MRHLIIFLSIALLGNAGAAVSGLYTYTVNADNVSVTITDYPTDATGEISIPDTIDGRSVTSIGFIAFMNCSSLTSVTIPNSVTSLADGAFQNCSSLTSVIIPDSATSIEEFAFASCISLTSINIGNSVTSIGGSAFQNCSSLTSINIPDSVTSIEGYAFYQCTNLASIRLESMAAPTIGTPAFDQISSAAVIHYRKGATGYAASYDGVPTLEDTFSYSTAKEVNTAVATATTQGQQDVVADPETYSLDTSTEVASSRTAGQQVVVAAPATYSLYTSATAQAQLIDLRTGSTMLNINGSNAVLQLQIQRSDDLSTWTMNPSDLISVPIDMNGGQGFYRFAMPQE